MNLVRVAGRTAVGTDAAVRPFLSFDGWPAPVCWMVVALLAGQPATRADNPRVIYTYDLNSSTFELDSLMASLSGVVARTTPEVFLAERLANHHGDPEFWLNQFVADHPGTSIVWQTSVPWYIHRYRDQISGYVVYDGASINEATSVAGALGAVMVHQSLLSGSIGAALNSAALPRLEDVRGRNSSWVFSQYGHLLNKDMIFRQQPNFSHQLRDLAVLNRGLVFNDTGGTRDLFLAAQNDHSRVLGWGYNNSEEEFFSSASQHNLMAVPADHLRSSAAPSRWEIPLPRQAWHSDLNTPTQPGVHYVAFVMSDGDNVQWLTNDFARDARWFGSPLRGSFPMTFDLSPSLADIHPVAMKYIYDRAAADSMPTQFVTAGGWGLHYPSQTPDIAGSIQVTAAAMMAVDHRTISVLDTSYNVGSLAAMVEHPDVLGLMIKTGPAYAGLQGAIDWHAGKPIVSVRHTLWDGFNTPDQIITALNGAPIDPFNRLDSYTIVNVHPWSTSMAGGGQGDPMSNVAYIAQNLGPHVRMVPLDELMIHLRNNFGSPVGSPWGSNLIANGDFEVAAVDGSGNPTNRPRNWYYSTVPGATAWVNDDSDGNGSHAAAIRQLNADWRSAEYETSENEILRLSFDFKLIGVPDGNGFRADARFFDQPGAGAGFIGEVVEFFDAADFPNGVWQEFSSQIQVPAGAQFGDVRFSTFFGPFAAGEVYIDDVVLIRLPNGDFDGNGVYNCLDVDSLVADIASGSNTSQFDMTGDGMVDQADLSAWLDRAGEINNATGNAYLYGDANLDAAVDGSDFNIWNSHRFTATAAWCEGDFNADGFVDGSDFAIWNANKFQSSEAAVIPEPLNPMCLIALLVRLAVHLHGTTRVRNPG